MTDIEDHSLRYNAVLHAYHYAVIKHPIKQETSSSFALDAFNEIRSKLLFMILLVSGANYLAPAVGFVDNNISDEDNTYTLGTKILFGISAVLPATIVLLLSRHWFNKFWENKSDQPLEIIEYLNPEDINKNSHKTKAFVWSGSFLSSVPFASLPFVYDFPFGFYLKLVWSAILLVANTVLHLFPVNALIYDQDFAVFVSAYQFITEYFSLTENQRADLLLTRKQNEGFKQLKNRYKNALLEKKKLIINASLIKKTGNYSYTVSGEKNIPANLLLDNLLGSEDELAPNKLAEKVISKWDIFASCAVNKNTVSLSEKTRKNVKYFGMFALWFGCMSYIIVPFTIFIELFKSLQSEARANIAIAEGISVALFPAIVLSVLLAILGRDISLTAANFFINKQSIADYLPYQAKLFWPQFIMAGTIIMVMGLLSWGAVFGLTQEVIPVEILQYLVLLFGVPSITYMSLNTCFDYYFSTVKYFIDSQADLEKQCFNLSAFFYSAKQDVQNLSVLESRLERFINCLDLINNKLFLHDVYQDLQENKTVPGFSQNSDGISEINEIFVNYNLGKGLALESEEDCEDLSSYIKKIRKDSSVKLCTPNNMFSSGSESDLSNSNTVGVSPLHNG